MWYGILYGILAGWVFIDAKKRMNHVVGWPLMTFIVGPVGLPVYFAKRHLKEGEVREGGTSWNVLKNFALFWTITMVVGGIASVIDATQAEEVGVALGVAAVLGLGLIATVWFIVLVAAVALGTFLKKSSIVEKGPTGPLAASVPEHP